MEALSSTATQACLLKSAQQPQLVIGRLSLLPVKCLSPRTTAMAFINKQGLPSDHCEPSKPWKIWLWSEMERKPSYIPGHSHNNPVVITSEKARWAALFLYKALLLLAVGLGATRPAMAKTAPHSAASDVRVQVSVEKAIHKTADKSALLGSSNESAGKEKVTDKKAEKTVDDNAEKGAQRDLESQSALRFGEEFWKDMDLSKGSIMTILKKILEGDPTNHDALECLSKTLLDNDDPVRALVAIQKLEHLEPGDLEWKYFKAVAYDMNGQFQLAKDIFEDILAFEPFSSKVVQGLMMAMDELGESDAVVDIAEQAMLKAREKKNVYEARNIGMLIGQYFMMKGHLHEALEHYQEMLEEDSKDFRPHLCQGIIYSAMGEKARADKKFKLYEKLCPKDYADKRYLDALMLKSKEEGQNRFELKQKEKYVKPFKFDKGSHEQPSANK